MARLKAHPAFGSVLLCIALVLPRLVRLGYGRASFIDPAYLEGAMRISRGAHPYRDFVHPQTPIPELVLGGLERLLGTTSHRVAEILTALGMVASTFLLLRLGQARLGRRAGVVAALLWAWHPFLLLLHVFSREVWVVCFALIAALASGPVWITLAAAAGFAAKPTFVLFLLPLAVAWPRKGLWALLGCAVAFGLCWIFYGRAFLVQAVLFHLLKGRPQGPLDYAHVVWLHIPILLPLAVAGLFATYRDRLVPVWFAVALGFLVLSSPTIWEHNLIELLPAAVLCTGALLSALYDRAPWVLLGALGATVALALFVATGQPTSYWIGLEGVPRAELRDVARSVASQAQFNDPIIAPLEVAAQSNRLMIIHYPEIEGLMIETERALRQGTLRDLLRETRRLGYRALCERSRQVWKATVEHELDQGKIPVVVLDDTMRTPFAAMQTVRISRDALYRRGFRVTMQTGRYTVFSRGALP